MAVRFTELPSFRKLGRGWQIRSFSLNCTLLHPSLYQVDLFVRESTLMGKLTVSWRRQPRGHKPRLRHLSDSPGVRLSVRVSEQRKRCRLTRTMARAAPLEENWSDIFSKRGIEDGLRKLAHTRI